MGAIVDPTQRKSIDTYVQQAKQDGAEVYQACACMPSHGCFYPPTLITKVEPVSVCVQEEVGEIISIFMYKKGILVLLIRKDPPLHPQSHSSIHSSPFQVFGPVLTVLTFRTAKEAIALANNTRFGLGASVWTENMNLALETAISLKAGACWVNCHNLFDAAAGFGGYRESGYGRDGGKEVGRAKGA